MNSVAVVDYGMGNLRSVSKALESVTEGLQEISVIVTGDPKKVADASHVIVPGVGAMPDCIREIEARGLTQAIVDAAKNKPFLGICLGLQMLFESSEEGNAQGLGVLSGKVVRFANTAGTQDAERKVPHMGWNQVRQVKSHPLWKGIPQDTRFYFVHSYYVETPDPAIVEGVTHYQREFASAIAADNIFAIQCHPEKSQAAGLALLKNFVQWNG